MATTGQTQPITINGIVIQRLNTKQTTHTLVQQVTTKEQRHGLDPLVYAEMRKACTKSGSVSITYADADQVSSVEDIYDFTHVVSTIERHLGEYDLTSTFQVPVPIMDTTTNPPTMTGDIEPNGSKNLFEEHASLSFDQIVNGLTWFENWVYDPKINQWVASDLEWSGTYLLNQMDDELREAIFDDIAAAKIPKGLKKAGPIIFKALVTRMLNTNEVTVRQYETYLQRDQVSLEKFDGNVEEFSKKYTAVITALRKCEVKDANGRIPSLIPPGLSETLLTILCSTENSLFNTTMNIQLAQCTTDQAQGVPNAFPTPEKVLSGARQLYVQYIQSGKWGDSSGSRHGPSAFSAGGKTKGKGTVGKCFGCGRDGCRHSNQSCPRHGKDANSEGKNAKQAFNEARKAKAEKAKEKGNSKWPPKPAKGQPNKAQIDGKWYWYHFKSKRWIPSKKDKNPSDKKEEKIADPDVKKNGKPGGLPSALASLAEGKDPKQIALQTDLYNQRIKEAQEMFASNLS